MQYLVVKLHVAFYIEAVPFNFACGLAVIANVPIVFWAAEFASKLAEVPAGCKVIFLFTNGVDDGVCGLIEDKFSQFFQSLV